MFGYKIVKESDEEAKRLRLRKFLAFVDTNMTMMDAVGKSEAGQYDPKEVAALWTKYWIMFREITGG
jgi:hypothetical protein